MSLSSRVPALGPRGEGWVALQTVVLGGVVACSAFGPRWPHALAPALRIVGYLFEAAGFALAIAARLALGGSFTILPRPRERSTLRRHGVYAHARHPIYGALVLIGIGLSLHRSVLVFLPTCVLAVVFLLKSILEEAWLTARYPDYDDYRRTLGADSFPGSFEPQSSSRCQSMLSESQTWATSSRSF